MNGKVKIEVFGTSRDPRTGGNSISLKMYFSLVRYMQSSDLGSKVNLRFIDIKEPAMANHPDVKSMLQKGTPVPIVKINGSVEYTASIPYESVYQDVKKLVSSK